MDDHPDHLDAATLTAQKAELRTRMRKAANSPWPANPSLRAAANAQIHNHVLTDKLWSRAEAIVIYVSFGHEVDTRPIIEAAWAADKRVYLPRILPKSEGRGRMQLHRHTSADALIRGPLGLQEPAPTAAADLETFPGHACIFVPGLAFTEAGKRLGQGGGFYDRFLAGLDQHAGQRERLGFAYQWQVLEDLPMAAYDQYLPALVTERGLRACAS